jgi:MFS family permease
MTSPHSSTGEQRGAGASGARRRAGGLAGRVRAELRTFPRQFWLLAFGFFVLLIGIDMCFPFETTYLHDRLGYSMTTIGLLLGVPLLVALPFYVLDGAIADRYGRKPSMIAGISFVVALYLTLAFATRLWQIGIAVSVEAAFGWALFLTGSNAMVADLVPYERRAEAYSITRVGMHLGMIAGPLLAGLVLARDPTYRWLFLAGSAVCLTFIAIVAIFFRETRPRETRGTDSMTATMRGYGVVLRDRRFLVFCGIAVLPFYVFGQIWSTLPVMLRNEHGVPPRTWGVILAFYALSTAIFQYPVIRATRRRDHVLLMALASGLVGLGLAGAVLLPYGVLTFASVFVLGQGVVLLIPIAASIAAELAPLALRGRYMGTWTLVQMAGYALGPTFGGWAMDGLGERGAALVIAACGVTGALLYVALARLLRVRGRSLQGA